MLHIWNFGTFRNGWKSGSAWRKRRSFSTLCVVLPTWMYAFTYGLIVELIWAPLRIPWWTHQTTIKSFELWMWRRFWSVFLFWAKIKGNFFEVDRNQSVNQSKTAKNGIVVNRGSRRGGMCILLNIKFGGDDRLVQWKEEFFFGMYRGRVDFFMAMESTLLRDLGKLRRVHGH